MAAERWSAAWRISDERSVIGSDCPTLFGAFGGQCVQLGEERGRIAESIGRLLGHHPFDELARRGGTSGRRSASGGAGWLRCCTATASGESPVNGGSPASMW